MKLAMYKKSHQKKSPHYRKLCLIPFSVIFFNFKIISFLSKIRLIASIFCIILPGIIGFLAPINWIWFFSFSGFLFGCYDLYYTYIKNKNICFTESFQVQDILEIVKPSYEEQMAGYRSVFIPEKNDCFFISEKANENIIKNSRKIKLIFNRKHKNKIIKKLQGESQNYRDILLCKYYESRRQGRMFFDEKKISLLTTISGTTTSVEIFESSYFLSFITNDLSTLNVEKYNDTLEPTLLQSAAKNFPCHDFDNNPKMKAFKGSLMSNHIGSNTLAITRSGRLIIWRQGRSAQRSTGLLAPTGSGSLDIKDLDYKHLNLESLVIAGMERELLEECHKSGDFINWSLIEKTKLIGFYRWIGKGGLPGFLGVTKLAVDIEDILPNISEVDNPKYIQTDYPADDIESLRNTINFLLKKPRMLSVPLHANLYSLIRVIYKTPQHLNFLFD
ncbi:hypothetical protein E1H12_19455 [Geitlerinema sp. P-1104]|uniref:hypothetical protein n=1 Tax=Geitlerinema sp. P-1104 TaxID=2546230 RepID=UPI0014774BD8|nr:hypothetical protein [Geitlerinema sp. P-1104]NMG60627.1 hypothetical protein [Geitlerinema sp. P-1104]